MNAAINKVETKSQTHSVGGNPGLSFLGKFSLNFSFFEEKKQISHSQKY